MSERKVALVTGGGSGIGEASALELARNGSDVVLIDVRQVRSNALPLRSAGWAAKR